MYQGQNGNGYNQLQICLDHTWEQSSKHNIDSRDEVENNEDMVMEFDVSSVESSSDLEIKKIFVADKYDTIKNLIDIDFEPDESDNDNERNNMEETIDVDVNLNTKGILDLNNICSESLMAYKNQFKNEKQRTDSKHDCCD